VAPAAPAAAAPAAGAAVQAPALVEVAASQALEGWRLEAEPGTRTTAAEAAAATRPMPPAQQIVAQLTVAIQRAPGERVEIRLDPPELGRVQIELSTRDGVLHATVIAERPEVHDLMRRHAEMLRQELAAAGHAGVRLEFANGSGQGEGGREAEDAAAGHDPRAGCGKHRRLRALSSPDRPPAAPSRRTARHPPLDDPAREEPIMELNPTAAATTTAAAAAAAARTKTETEAGAATSDFQTFLQLLTAQLRNQDPLKPMESTEFVAQLASFSAVEQQVRTNDRLDRIAEMLSGGTPDGLAQWIGREVRAPVAANYQGVPVEVEVTPKEGADTAVLVVRNDFGQIVARKLVPAGPRAW
jgi:hypothetical protein